ncbi:MAG: archaellin/type IV pilin N-terminal domain-containing protein [Candidatus Methanomethyliaceae archaeon]
MQKRNENMGWMKNKKGLTGIETAIILIAFVISASVFAFAVLNMGLLTTSKAQEAIVSGVSQAQSSVKITSVYAFADDNRKNVTGIALMVQISGTHSVDFYADKIAISYKNDRVAIPDVYEKWKFINASEFSGDTYKGDFKLLLTSYNWTEAGTGCIIVEVQGDGDNLLEAGEIFAVVMNLEKINENAPLKVYEIFTIELIPGHGSKLTFTGQVPASLLGVMVLSGA